MILPKSSASSGVIADGSIPAPFSRRAMESVAGWAAADGPCVDRAATRDEGDGRTGASLLTRGSPAGRSGRAGADGCDHPSSSGIAGGSGRRGFAIGCGGEGGVGCGGGGGGGVGADWGSSNGS